MRIVADRWFDGERFRREPVTILVSGGAISALEPHGDGTGVDSEPVLDARGRLVLPGLIDAHAHIARAGFFEADEPPLQVAQIVRNFQGALRAGVTTVADMGCTIPMLARLRRLTADDPLAGPRFVGAGPVLTASEGYPFVWISELWRHAEAALAVDDEVSAARAVGKTVAHGMDHIKVAIMHESFAREPIPALTPRAARAVVREATTLGRRVYAHAHSNRDYEVALDAGVHALMHSSFDPLTPELVLRIADSGVCVNPTLWAYDGTCQVGACRMHRRPDLQQHATPALRRSRVRSTKLDAMHKVGLDVTRGGAARPRRSGAHRGRRHRRSGDRGAEPRARPRRARLRSRGHAPRGDRARSACAGHHLAAAGRAHRRGLPRRHRDHARQDAVVVAAGARGRS